MRRIARNRLIRSIVASAVYNDDLCERVCNQQRQQLIEIVGFVPGWDDNGYVVGHRSLSCAAAYGCGWFGRYGWQSDAVVWFKDPRDALEIYAAISIWMLGSDVRGREETLRLGPARRSVRRNSHARLIRSCRSVVVVDMMTMIAGFLCGFLPAYAAFLVLIGREARQGVYINTTGLAARGWFIDASRLR